MVRNVEESSDAPVDKTTLTANEEGPQVPEDGEISQHLGIRDVRQHQIDLLACGVSAHWVTRAAICERRTPTCRANR